MIRGKRGFIRILEAFIAIMIISGAMAFIYVNQVQKPNEAEAIRELERIILDEIANNQTLRQDVLDSNLIKINNTISKFISNDFNYDFKICDLNELCKLDTFIEGEVFSDEVTVSSTLKDYGPKVLRIFIWEKN